MIDDGFQWISIILNSCINHGYLEKKQGFCATDQKEPHNMLGVENTANEEEIMVSSQAKFLL